MPPKHFDPVTPTNQVAFNIGNPPEGTPLGLQDYFDEEEPTDVVRELVASLMNSETFLCHPDAFMKDYGPAPVSKEHVLKCKEYLVQHQRLDRKSKDEYIFSAFHTPPSKTEGKEVEVFRPVEKIVEAIFDYAASVSERRNTFTFLTVGNNELQASIEGTNHKMDACLVEDTNYTGVLRNNNIVIAKEFKKVRDEQNQLDVRTQVVGDCHHIMNDDIRRKFMYGTTMEDTRMSVWYFSRSHSVKAISFDWVSKDVDLFIEVYLSFAFATPAQLGIDPLVHKLSIDPQSNDPYRRMQQYVYECRPEEDYATPGATQTRYYMTRWSLSPERPYRISGRTTRVWEVIEVDSATNSAKRVRGAKPVILKDVWTDITRKTEAENMDLIFEAVDKMVADARQRYPGPQGLQKFMDVDPRFSGFSPQIKKRLQQLLTNKQYRSLFLTKRHAWKGETTKKISDQVKLPLKELFVPKIVTKLGKGRKGELTRTHYSRSVTSLQPNKTAHQRLKEKLVPTAIDDRAFGEKRQSRFVYEEVCTTLWQLPTLGDLIDVVRQAIDVLHILYLVGWVHRDISNGNILAVRVDEGTQTKWKVKVSDFEFAQTHGHRSYTADPRTGTPYFMPTEVLAKEHLFETLRSDEPETDNFADQLNNIEGRENNPHYQRLQNFKRFEGARLNSLPANATDDIPATGATVVYNYQHDLESIWWIVLYYITVGVGHKDSLDWAENIFVDDLELNRQRDRAFISNIRPKLKAVVSQPLIDANFPNFMEEMRSELHCTFVGRELFGHINIHESYSSIQGYFADKFDGLLAGNVANWKQIRVVHFKPENAPQKRPIDDDDDDSDDDEDDDAHDGAASSRRKRGKNN